MTPTKINPSPNPKSKFNPEEKRGGQSRPKKSAENPVRLPRKSPSLPAPRTKKLDEESGKAGEKVRKTGEKGEVGGLDEDVEALRRRGALVRGTTLHRAALAPHR